MGQKEIRLIEREFALFGSKVSELKKLRRVLDSLSSKGPLREVRMIEAKLSNVDNIPKVEVLLANLKHKVKKREIESKYAAAHLIKRLFELNDNIRVWDRKKLKNEYMDIRKQYLLLSEEDKIPVYGIITEMCEKLNRI
jgi:hypothetical protein